MDFKSRNDGAILGMHKCYHFDMNHVFTYDSTLRDGEQAEGISLSLEDKLLIVSCLDDFGVGFPHPIPKTSLFSKPFLR